MRLMWLKTASVRLSRLSLRGPRVHPRRLPPRKSGLEVCRELRESGITAPILMLTARDSVPDLGFGLDAGADDYLPKPFHFDESLPAFARCCGAARCWDQPRLRSAIPGSAPSRNACRAPGVRCNSPHGNTRCSNISDAALMRW